MRRQNGEKSWPVRASLLPREGFDARSLTIAINPDVLSLDLSCNSKKDVSEGCETSERQIAVLTPLVELHVGSQKACRGGRQ